MSAWDFNHSEIIRTSINLGKFPKRADLENLMGPLPDMSEMMAHEFSRMSEWGFETWRQEWCKPRPTA